MNKALKKVSNVLVKYGYNNERKSSYRRCYQPKKIKRKNSSQ